MVAYATPRGNAIPRAAATDHNRCMKAASLHRRRAPRSTRAGDPLIETAAIALLAVLAFCLLIIS